MRMKSLVGLALAAVALTGVGMAQTTVDLFNGRDLSGWMQHGGKAKYAVENGEIVGTSVLNTPNSFLCTEKTYGDFVLEYDFKVDPKLNSGVQIRSECFDKPTEVQWQGKTIKIPADRVHGYQIEIDPDVPRKRLWSAGIYDEARRGWLYPSDGEKGTQGKAFSEQGLRIFKPNDWNHVRVVAFGDTIRTWLNGEPCAYLRDSMTPRGIIALQVHAIGKDQDKAGTQVRWRNLKITELTSADQIPANTLTDAEKAAGWQLLWDGKTGDGWRSPKTDAFPTKGWTIKNGVLTVHENGGEESAGGGDIITRQRYSQFELQVDFQLTPGANSGIKYFVQPNLSPIDKKTGRPTGVGSAIGLEYQVLDDLRHPDAKLGRNGDRTLASLYDLMPAATTKRPNPIGEWNTARIVVRGNHVQHWLNGQLVLAYDRGSPEFRDAVALSKFKNIPDFGEWADGHILLQEHGNQVSFRNVKIHVLTR